MVRRVRSVFVVFFIATAAALAARLFFVEDYRIVSDSMYPTLWAGDLVFVSKAAFNLRLPFSSLELVTWRRPARGEVVAFGLPERGLETFVKRVVALEGDQVEIRDGALSVNGTRASYPTRDGGTREAWADGLGYPVKWAPGAQKNYGPVLIPKGHFFALGDNRLDSVDSRTWGPVPYSCLKGRIAVVWLSLDAGGSVRRARTGTRANL